MLYPIFMLLDSNNDDLSHIINEIFLQSHINILNLIKISIYLAILFL